MLWIEYESSELVNKWIIKDILAKVAILISPAPVAAEDYNTNGFGIIACDHNSGGRLFQIN